MGRPKLLDLFCCEGGAGVGYDRAGFDVYGVDMDGKFVKRYPFAFRRDDALDVLVRMIEGAPIAFTHPDGSIERVEPEEFDAIHASPPCQGYTRGNAGKVTNWPKLIPDVRALQSVPRPITAERTPLRGLPDALLGLRRRVPRRPIDSCRRSAA